MNLYEEHLYELYKDCFELKFLGGIKEMERGERRCFGSMVASLVILTISYFGLLLRQRIFAYIFVASFCIFLASVLVLLLYVMFYRKAFKKKTRERNILKIMNFNKLLIKNGLKEDQQISIVLDSLKSNYLNRRKMKERKHDVFFKYIVTFIVSVLIFVSKEKWERIKPNISESDFNTIFEASTKVLIFLIIVFVYIFIVNLNTFNTTKEEKLIKALEEVLLYRKGVKGL
ncbi:hypothetical protein [Enterococcus faecalis]|uniref:hypothetical protein n=1 Tax=Enterococcus faecalis TaxID=1351 RepID=UPI003D0CEEF8